MAAMGQCQALPVPSKLLDSLWIRLGTPMFTKALGPSADLSGTLMPTQALDLL